MKTQPDPTTSPSRQRKTRFLLGCALCGLVVFGLAPILGHGMLQEPAQSTQVPPAVDPIPSANQPDAVNGQQKNQSRTVETAIDANKTQISGNAAKLLKLATDLKAEVDKSTKDTLSLGVIRKANEIEKLAHDVRANLKPAAGPS